MPRKTPRKRTQVMLDEDIYEAFKAVPRSVSVSDVINVIFRSVIEDLKRFPAGMSDEDMREWRKADSKRLEVVKYVRDELGLGKYVDTLAKVIDGQSFVPLNRRKKKV